MTLQQTPLLILVQEGEEINGTLLLCKQMKHIELITIDKSEAPHSAEFLNADIVTYEKAASDKCQLELGLF